MTTLLLGYKAIHGKVKAISLPQINWKFIYALGIGWCFALVIFYVLLVNQLTNGAYLVKNYNKEINTLTKDNKAIEADFEQTGFLDSMHGKVQSLGFEKISQIKYIEILHSSLAKAP